MNCYVVAFQTSKLCSFSHFRWSNTHPLRRAKHAKNCKSE
nr:MAG TPA: hypothetical protein [Microviridae sp.]